MNICSLQLLDFTGLTLQTTLSISFRVCSIRKQLWLSVQTVISSHCARVIHAHSHTIDWKWLIFQWACVFISFSTYMTLIKDIFILLMHSEGWDFIMQQLLGYSNITKCVQEEGIFNNVCLCHFSFFRKYFSVQLFQFCSSEKIQPVWKKSFSDSRPEEVLEICAYRIYVSVTRLRVRAVLLK